MKRDATSPESYRNDVDGELAEMLETIRSVIFEAGTDVEETIEYGMLDYPGIANLAAQKNYVSLYVKPAVLDDFRDRFDGVDCGKSCLRFKRQDQINRELVAELIQAVEARRKPLR
jgi:uncharacterized protein YdhG (YjbR/CyaY superfamily)